MQEGTFTSTTYKSNVYIYKRELANQEVVVVVLNFGDEDHTIDLTTVFGNLPAQLTVKVTSVQSRYTPG